MAGVKGILSVIKRQYDRWIAFLMLLGLVASVLYLAIRIGTIRIAQARFEEQIESLEPAHPVADQADPRSYSNAVVLMENPPQLGTDTGYVFVPEKRVWCVDCRRPIAFAIAEQGGNCPFCGARQPPDDAEVESFDGDGDGMWDSWERAHGLDPHDPRDAEQDYDGDGYSNIAEFRAGTDPRDPTCFPPPDAELRVVRIVADPFMLRFRGKQRLAGGLMFQINLRDADSPASRSYFKRLGEEVEGFEIVDYEERIVERVIGESAVPRKVDESILTLRQGDKRIPLVYNQDVQYDEYTAELVFKIDGTPYSVKHGSRFDLRGRQYEVLRIDIAEETVVVKRLQDGKQLTIGKFPATEGN